jgi:hypothetical protein
MGGMQEDKDVLPIELISFDANAINNRVVIN